MAGQYSRFAVLPVLALVFSATQCVTVCAAEACPPSGAGSPCHQHEQAPRPHSPAPCGHDLQLLGTNVSSITQASLAVSPIDPAMVSLPLAALGAAPSLHGFSPPDLTLSSAACLSS